MILVNFGDELVHGDKSPKRIAKDNSFNFIDKSSVDITSNSLIYRNVIRTAVEVDKPAEYIFLIGWTKKDRIDYRYDGKEIIFQKNNYNHPIKIYNKLNKFNAYLFEPVLINQQLISLVFSTQQVLKSLGIKYYMYNTADKIDYNNYTMNGLKTLENRFYHNALSYDSSMQGYLAKQGLQKDNYGAWANFLAQKMRAAGVIEK